MGLEYETVIVVGFEVPEDWAFKFHEHTPPPPCDHDNAEGAVFCSACGNKLEVVPRKVRQFRPNRGLPEDLDDYWETDGCSLRTLDNGVEVLWAESPALSEGFLLAGTKLVKLEDPHRSGANHTLTEMPELPSQAALADMLHAAGISFRVDSYGIHVVLLVG